MPGHMHNKGASMDPLAAMPAEQRQMTAASGKTPPAVSSDPFINFQRSNPGANATSGNFYRLNSLFKTNNNNQACADDLRGSDSMFGRTRLGSIFNNQD